MATQVTTSNFKELVEKSGKPVLIDFWAEWCGPCLKIGPVVEELAAEYEGKVIVAKCNVDDNTELATTFGIRSIPTFLLFKNGTLSEKIVGLVPKAKLIEKLDALV